ncbi:hypothetical protein [Siphonobacter sp. BAB-5385]|uniref:hypothetical protein n=1 Tax=Siphonobacter sp. BAB-5385 TaxID=1864822 RepID=UPI0020CB7956|nr:hypothetical protein [Siphonobacter sp. BAB-5385]
MRIYSTLLTGVMACTLTFVSCTKSVPTTHSKTLATETLPSEKSEYMDVVQKATFRYFWDFGHPISGMAAERTATPNIVTTGGTGFGLMGMVVAAERQWITREAAVAAYKKLPIFWKKPTASTEPGRTGLMATRAGSFLLDKKITAVIW